MIAVRSSNAGLVAHYSIAVVVSIMATAIKRIASLALGITPKSYRATGPFGWLVDTLDALGAAPFAGRHMPGASCFATVAGQACLLDAATRQSHVPRICIRFIVRAWKSQTLAIGADGASAVAANFTLTARSTGRRRFLGATVGSRVEGSFGKRPNMRSRHGEAALSSVGVYFHRENLM